MLFGAMNTVDSGGIKYRILSGISVRLSRRGAITKRPYLHTSRRSPAPCVIKLRRQTRYTHGEGCANVSPVVIAPAEVLRVRNAREYIALPFSRSAQVSIPARGCLIVESAIIKTGCPLFLKKKKNGRKKRKLPRLNQEPVM